MIRHLGYTLEVRSSPSSPASRADRSLGTNHAGVREQIRKNLEEFAQVLRVSAEKGIRFHRVSSRIIPLASDPEKTVPWWDEFAGDLARIGHFVRTHGLRLEMHPGPHLLLNSPSPETVALSILELGWQVRFLDALQIDTKHKLVLRVGATFGDHKCSMDRFVCLVNGFPAAWKARLVVENHETTYGLADVLRVSELTGIPVVFACRGDWTGCLEALNLSHLILKGFDSWLTHDGTPIVHFVSRIGDRATSGDPRSWIESGVLGRILAMIPANLPFDCLLESDQGERERSEILERISTHEAAVSLAERLNEQLRRFTDL